MSAEESQATAVLGWVNVAVSDGLNSGLLLGEHFLLGGEHSGLVGKNGLLGSDNSLFGSKSGLLILELFLLLLGIFLIVLALIVLGGKWCGNNFERRWGSVNLDSAEFQLSVFWSSDGCNGCFSNCLGGDFKHASFQWGGDFNGVPCSVGSGSRKGFGITKVCEGWLSICSWKVSNFKSGWGFKTILGRSSGILSKQDLDVGDQVFTTKVNSPFWNFSSYDITSKSSFNFFRREACTGACVKWPSSGDSIILRVEINSVSWISIASNSWGSADSGDSSWIGGRFILDSISKGGDWDGTGWGGEGGGGLDSGVSKE